MSIGHKFTIGGANAELSASARAALQVARAAMRALGYSVVERSAPLVVSAGVEPRCAWYSTEAHVIGMGSELTEAKTLWHELCHSQQANEAPPAYVSAADRDTWRRMWIADPAEQEADAIGALAGRSDWRELCALCDGHPLARHRDLIRLGVEHGAGRVAVGLAAIDAASEVSPDRRMDWLLWFLRGDISHPEHLPRRQRQAMNAARIA